MSRVFIDNGSPSNPRNLHRNALQRLDSWNIPRTRPYFYTMQWVTAGFPLCSRARSRTSSSARAVFATVTETTQEAPQLIAHRHSRSSPPWPKPFKRRCFAALRASYLEVFVVPPSPLERRRFRSFAKQAKAWSLTISASTPTVRGPSVDGRRWCPQHRPTCTPCHAA